jgi:chemotaxis protein CheX
MSSVIQDSDALTRPFIESTRSVFSMMLGWQVERGETCNASAFQSKYDVSGIIGFSGALRGTVVISLDQAVAFAAAESFLGSRPESINAEIVDLVGELANMIGGNAKERMGIAGINLGLPTVISGKGHYVSFDPGARVEILPFETAWGPLTVEIGIRTPR